MNPIKHIKWLLPAGIAAALNSCAPAPVHTSYTPVSARPSTSSSSSSTASMMSPQKSLYEWYDDGGPGEVSVQIKISSQMATFMRGGREIGWAYVATGRSGHRTPTGSFRIQEKSIEKISNRWGKIVDEQGNTVKASARSDEPKSAGQRWVAAPMPYWMRLTSSGIGMHAGPIPNPGSPASAGCIRLPRQVASRVYNVVKIGTPVTVTQ